MVIGILAAIGAILNGIGIVAGKAWDVTKSIMDWFTRVLPKPLKFFFFLYFILFIISTIMPTFLGSTFSCDSQGDAYKMNFIELQTTSAYVDRLSSICGLEEEEQPEQVPDYFSFTDFVSSIWSFFKETFLTVPGYWKVYHAYELGKTNETENVLCAEWESFIQTNETPSRDFVLQHWGEKVLYSNYKGVVHIGCVQNNEGEWYQTLKFFDMDIFNFELWLLLGVIGFITPLAFKWYNFVFKR